MCDSVAPPAHITVMSQEGVQWVVELPVRIWGSNEIYSLSDKHVILNLWLWG